ncbi:MAG TPA: conjugal transfer protein TraF [Deltaproteobacteria bacterium]|nr:conjugal transfer protein TraF [Deltaproteobacteria bacterium]HPR54107.1 conjugal transfer protein TraF [Deltaproteobacteria bacterium]HXK47055.1 conjugal transfer protein TraF [Deltaproteobacteria bacterium]
MKTILALCTVLLICLSTVSPAAEYPYIYKGMRPMGMGGAFVAVSNDVNALFYNPAGLADIGSIRASIFPLEMEISENSYTMYKDAADVDFDSEEETAEFLRDHIGDLAHFNLALVPSYSMPRFAFCAFGTARMDLEAHDRQYPKLGVQGISDVGLGAGYAHPLMDDSLLVGASLKYVFRQSISEVYTVTDIADSDFDDRMDDDLKDGQGILLDLGVIYKLNVLGLADTRIGLSANNLIGSKLGDAEDLDDHVDIGVAQDIDLKVTRLTLALDYVDLFSQLGDDDDLAKRIRMGAELELLKFLEVRAGIYQGYLTAGLGLDGRIVRLDLVTYAEEIGTYAGQRADRRYAVRFAMGF